MSSTTAKSPDVSRRSERSRKAILQASMELVGEVGYPKLTIEAIAARAGVGKQTIYRWWPSKAAVLLDAFTEVVHDEDYSSGLPDTGDIEADLKYVLRATADEFSDASFEAPYRALAVAAAADGELADQFVSRLSEPGVRVYIERLRAGQEAGQIDPDLDLYLAVELLLGPFQQRWLNRTGPLTHEFTDGLVELAMRALAPRGAPR
ncbi:TetR/AcrR family transcriptional regulator [Streptomyces sp. A73]|uniref:TetR/AcrR family transcriptional regulator n=1 Tax=Streptomyces TaxID=1883 RepID=UPI001B35DABF|nr:TetR/AcrR family transcriptional regulator [Streptomyces sp. RK75]MBQ0863393.1 TetR/AcrR family transcriptional regulator [Streptomyces sp. RK75]MBQ1161054.1 TetR/AcrR family transcriptional regulator [Streptomyces sp. A73]